MDETPPRIEIFAPCETALELTKKILFQPFDLAKWFVLGFAAFLANLGGGGGSFNIPTNWGNGGEVRSATDEVTSAASTMPDWLLPLLIVGGIFFLALIIVATWLGARGQFIFTDGIVKNRGAIVEPWREYRREGNSLFLFRLAVVAAFFFIAAVAATPLWLPWALRRTPPEGAGLVVGLLLLISVVALGSIGWVMASYFMVPIMYRRRVGPVAALRASAGLLFARPGPVILFFLFSVVLLLAVTLLACVATCLTCCLTAIPYLGTVILLPLFVFRHAFLLLFVRQFGPDCDVWADLTPTLPMAAPPVQEMPPPAL